ncbi:hypothetical protein G1H11_14210 [Phytoactinopolyspora alkaliphila]|uniref:Uncharacterized protein n=1 Tax=Phytoactinopolyspora alkaliphila TaxID=1783498 RepID=A0A6N9YNF2_9ACTN|nr:hypothetical protein [Phytoactinopolyspora alkaliphila]NED96460.1 hypothetical protein [Phytoactinopolyspora alkaliphila]
MSAETARALEEALRAHVADEDDGSFVTGWIIIAAAAMPEDGDATSYSYITPEMQPVHASMGLLAMAQRWFNRCDNQEDE